MDVTTILALVKSRQGITVNVRDAYLTAIIEGIIQELQDVQGIALDSNNQYHLMFVVDYATWRYKSRDEQGGMPRDLRFRLNNLFIHDGGAG